MYATPAADGTIDERYRAVAAAVERALASVDLAVTRGVDSGSFCPGTYSLVGIGKVAAFAQRVRAAGVLVGGIIIVRNHERLQRVLVPVYEALANPFDPDTVGSVERSGVDVGVNAIRNRLIDELERNTTGA